MLAEYMRVTLTPASSIGISSENSFQCDAHSSLNRASRNCWRRAFRNRKQLSPLVAQHCGLATQRCRIRAGHTIGDILSCAGKLRLTLCVAIKHAQAERLKRLVHLSTEHP